MSERKRIAWHVLSRLAGATMLLAIAGLAALPSRAGAQIDPCKTYKVCLYMGTKDTTRAVDVVFVPEASYNTSGDKLDLKSFLADVQFVIDQSFFQVSGLHRNRDRLNFWYYRSRAELLAPEEGKICPTVHWPWNIEHPSKDNGLAFAEVFILLHRKATADCAQGIWASASVTSTVLAVHEFSHVAFLLPDEYPQDGNYWNKPPVLYRDEAECDKFLAGSGWGIGKCAELRDRKGNTWWRSEGMNNDVMLAPSKREPEYGLGDWAIVRAELQKLHPNAVVDPDVFAPQTWP